MLATAIPAAALLVARLREAGAPRRQPQGSHQLMRIVIAGAGLAAVVLIDRPGDVARARREIKEAA